MAVPLILSDVPNVNPYIQYVATGGQTVFPYPFPITQDSDLIVVPNGVTLNTDTGYTLTGQGNDTGGDVVFTLGRTAGDIITLYRDIEIQRISQIAQNSGFSSTVFNAEFNNIYLIMQQLEASIAQCLQIPNTNNPAPTTLITPAIYANKYQAYDGNGNPVPAVLTSSGTLTAQIIGSLTNPQTAAETTALITPSNFTYVELDPRRYGAVGDGVADDTAALNKLIAVANAYASAAPNKSPTAVWPAGLNFLCSPLSNVTANNFTIRAAGTTIQAKPNVGGNNPLLSVGGNGFKCYGLVLDGNQFATTSGTYAAMLSLTGNDVLLDSVSTIRGDTWGAFLNQVSGGKFINCHFDSNANLGIEFETCSYLKFTNCTFSFNGYGYKQTLPTNLFVGFGFALRFRSHHCTFVSCDATQNGRDGMNVNEGSYSVKFIGCFCWENFDGGFTVAADALGSGKPGDGQLCFNLEYIDCEAYNNWAAGLAFFSNGWNYTVDGGRYYNNHRLAGSLANAEGFACGILVSPSSWAVRIRTLAYDDRQICPVTANSSGVISATGWVPGTMASYPTVSLYTKAVSGGGYTFQGYGTITSESSGVVTVVSTAFNGVTVASIASGWYITQRTQHVGVLFGVGCTATAEVTGYGHLPGPSAWDLGAKVYSDPTSNNQNVQLPLATLDYTELLAEPTWDSSTGSGAAWNYTLPSGASANSFTTPGALLRSPGCLQLVGGTSVLASGNGSLISSGLQYVSNGAWVEFSCWSYAVNSGDATVGLTWGNANQNTFVKHPGGGWRLMKIGAYVPAGASELIAEVISAPGKTNYFDTASLRVRNDSYDALDTIPPPMPIPVLPV